VIDDLLRAVPDGVVLDVRVGAFWSAVVVASENQRRCGLASNLHAGGHEHGAGSRVREAGRLNGRPAAELTALARSESLIEASIGFATINALLARKWEEQAERNAGEVLAREGAGRRVVLVGSFPFIPRLRERVGSLDVLDQRPGPDRLPAQAAAEVVPRADILAITGTSLINHSFEPLMALRNPGARVMVLGPSTPLSPVLFEHGVELLSGAVVQDIDTVLQGVSQGANFRQIKPLGVRLVTLQGGTAG
jgi:uncharacterized protein (DUF4213/DUF364 family)